MCTVQVQDVYLRLIRLNHMVSIVQLVLNSELSWTKAQVGRLVSRMHDRSAKHTLCHTHRRTHTQTHMLVRAPVFDVQGIAEQTLSRFLQPTSDKEAAYLDKVAR